MNTVEQRNAQLLFELLDCLRNRGLGNIQLVLSLGQTAALGNRAEYFVKFEIDHPFSLPHTEFFENFVDH